MTTNRERARNLVKLVGATFVVIAWAASAQNVTKGLVDDRRLLAANDGADENWITFGQDYRNQRFSSLTQVSRGNVGKLVPAWIYQTGAVGSSQVQPLAIDGVLYFTNTINDVIAADAATGEEVWRYRHKFAGSLPRDPRNRGVAVGYGKVFLAANDRRVVALDQTTGKTVWEYVVAGFDPRSHPGLGQPGKPLPDPIPFVLIAAPLVANGLVIVGATGFEQNDIGDASLNAGGDVIGDWIQNNLGRRAFLFALDAATGKEVWRWYTTKTDGWEGDYVEAAPGGEFLNRDTKTEREMAARYKDAWAAGSTATWMTPSYDAASGLIFLTTGNPAPGNILNARSGDNLYANSIVALEAKTGKLRWYLQQFPHGNYDSISQTVLFDATIDGRTVPAVGNGSKTGYFYVMDRVTGKFLYQSEPVVRVQNLFTPATKDGILRAPGGGGGIGVSPTSYDPNTGYVYAAAIDRPAKVTLMTVPGKAGFPDIEYERSVAVPPNEAWGTLTALDLRNKGKVVWQVKTKEPLVGGTLATAGGVVFTGEANGRFNAFDAANGKLLWSFQTGANVGAPPISYSVNGRQYIAVATGAAAPDPGVPIPAGGLRPGGAIIGFALPQ